MPKVFRVMKESDGKPAIGDRRNMLGVRPPGSSRPDVDVCSAGNVTLNDKGLSVTPSNDTGFCRIPRRLKKSADRGAVGSDQERIWSMGTGSFTRGRIAANLHLAVGATSHGTICPSIVMALPVFQQALASTQSQWSVDE